MNGTAYHKSCFKCSHGGCVISPSNYIAHEGRLYCKHHHTQLIKEKGNLSQLEGDHEKDPANEKAESWSAGGVVTRHTYPFPPSSVLWFSAVSFDDLWWSTFSLQWEGFTLVKQILEFFVFPMFVWSFWLFVVLCWDCGCLIDKTWLDYSWYHMISKICQCYL